jgi:hypothetical protein
MTNDPAVGLFGMVKAEPTGFGSDDPDCSTFEPMVTGKAGITNDSGTKSKAKPPGSPSGRLWQAVASVKGQDHCLWQLDPPSQPNQLRGMRDNS